eukprot:5895546-Prymnesium_polylepis.1
MSWPPLVPGQLHFALFDGSDGYLLKPPEMRKGLPEDGEFAPAPEEEEPWSHEDDKCWPPPRDYLHCATIDVISLHNLPKVEFSRRTRARLPRARMRLVQSPLPVSPAGSVQRGEMRPKYSGSRGACHNHASELSGSTAPPDNTDSITPALTMNIYGIGGFCAISNTLPLPQSADGELQMSPRSNGMNAEFNETAYCAAAEPHATFLRIGVIDNRQEVAYETA